MCYNLADHDSFDELFEKEKYTFRLEMLMCVSNWFFKLKSPRIDSQMQRQTRLETLANAYFGKIRHICFVQTHCIYDVSLGRRHVDPSDRPIYYIDNRTTASPPHLGSSHNFIDQGY